MTLNRQSSSAKILAKRIMAASNEKQMLVLQEFSIFFSGKEEQRRWHSQSHRPSDSHRAGTIGAANKFEIQIVAVVECVQHIK